MPTNTLTPGDGLDLDNPNQAAKQDGSVECLGNIFANDAERREHYLGLLAKKLKDPEFRKIEGFPIGEDEDILELSDPPYYTACPNPFIEEFIRFYGRPYDPAEKYKREPYAADVSEGKNDPIYNAHSYHTKVPHKAIMRYILHYTSPGDLVFDGFCGSGMTGVAAQMCGDRAVVESLGYKVLSDGSVLQEMERGEGEKTEWIAISKLGPRKVALNDLSPAATSIAYNYNVPVDPISFDTEANRILGEVEAECRWMYETKHSDGSIGKIEYMVWSDVFVCSECTEEIVFWDNAVEVETGAVNDKFPCPTCQTELTKRQMERAWESKYDTSLDKTIRQSKQVPVLINYSYGRKRYTKKPDSFDFELIKKIEGTKIKYWHPITEVPLGDKTGEPIRLGITNVHQLQRETFTFFRHS